MEGVHENVIFGGGDDGCLYFWKAWDLSPCARHEGHHSAITAIAIKYVYSLLYLVVGHCVVHNLTLTLL